MEDIDKISTFVTSKVKQTLNKNETGSKYNQKDFAPQIFNLTKNTSMSKDEFRTRTGLLITDEEFDNIKEVYMNIGDNKDEFCMHFSTLDGMIQLLIKAGNAIKEEAATTLMMKKRGNNLKKLCKKEREEFADWLMNENMNAVTPNDRYTKMGELVGENGVLLRKCLNGVVLDESERKMVCELFERNA